MEQVEKYVEIAAETKNEIDQAKIADLVAHEMEEGGRFYPFKFFRIKEAIENMSEADWMLFSTWIGTAHDLKFDNKFANEIASRNICESISNYWSEVATETITSEYRKD